MTAPCPAGHRALGTCVPKIWSACREEGSGFEWSVLIRRQCFTEHNLRLTNIIAENIFKEGFASQYFLSTMMLYH